MNTILKSILSLGKFINPGSVDSAVKGVQKAIDKLDAAAEHAVSSKDIITTAIKDLGAEWDHHNEQHRRAVAISSKLKDLIS